MDNKYTGHVTLIIGGQRYTIVYDWNAIALLQSEFGQDFAVDLSAKDPQTLAKMLEIGLKKHHSDLTAERIREISPPLIHVAKVIDRAVLYAYWGPDDAQKLIEAAEEVVKSTEKKTRSPKRSSFRFASAFRRTGSGS